MKKNEHFIFSSKEKFFLIFLLFFLISFLIGALFLFFSFIENQNKEVSHQKTYESILILNDITKNLSSTKITIENFSQNKSFNLEKNILENNINDLTKVINNVRPKDSPYVFSYFEEKTVELQTITDLLEVQSRLKTIEQDVTTLEYFIKAHPNEIDKINTNIDSLNNNININLIKVMKINNTFKNYKSP